MSLSKTSLNNSLWLTAATLALALAGCGGNQTAPETSQSTPVSSSGSSSVSAGQGGDSAQATYEPVVERINVPVPLAEGHPNEYVVQVGDTLWDIAGRFLKDPWYWPEIWYVNPDIVNPHLIYPGDVLGLVYIDGQPRVTNIRASTFRLSPQARVTPLTEAVASIPYEKVAAFLQSGAILEKKQADGLPYLLQVRGDNMVASAGNEIYVRDLTDTAPGTRYQIVHISDPLRDPDDNRLIGYVGIPVADGRLVRGGDPATVALTDSSREARQGDRLLPEDDDIPLNFFPRAPSTAVEGRIITVIGGVTQIGQYMVVVLNRGTDHGLATGDVLSIFQTGGTVEDRVGGGKVTLPEEDVGTTMVFKTFDRISYGLVMEATQAIHIHDTVRNPN
jgi:LysM repeat protein